MGGGISDDEGDYCEESGIAYHDAYGVGGSGGHWIYYSYGETGDTYRISGLAYKNGILYAASQISGLMCWNIGIDPAAYTQLCLNSLTKLKSVPISIDNSAARNLKIYGDEVFVLITHGGNVGVEIGSGYLGSDLIQVYDLGLNFKRSFSIDIDKSNLDFTSLTVFHVTAGKVFVPTHYVGTYETTAYNIYDAYTGSLLSTKTINQRLPLGMG